MIYDLVKQVKETGVGADGTVVCSMDELVALVDYVEELMYKKGRNTGYAEGRFESLDDDYEDDYEDDYRLGYRDGYEDGCEDGYNDMLDVCDCNDNKPTLEEFFKEYVLMQMRMGR